MNNTIIKRACVMATVFTAMTQASAIAPLSGPVRMTQPDGTPLTVTITGNEHRAVYRSLDGYLLLPASDGTLCYAVFDGNGEPIASEVAASDEEQRNTDASALLRSIDREEVLSRYTERLRQADLSRSTGASMRMPRRRNKITDYPASGKQKVLVILAQFADIKFYRPDPFSDISRMLNEKGYSENGSTGSVRDYFIDNSCGKYEPEMVVYGPVTLPQNMEYYGAPSSTGNDSRPEQMVSDACKLLDREINFNDYDLDDDGYIDNVYLFYPGYSQADGANPNTIWPHASYAWSKTHSEFDGVRLDHYACSNELDMLSNQLVNIGTFCHEFTHVLGLPDFYSTDYSHALHPDSWSLMANGGRNNDGRTPPYMSAYERYSLGWLEPEELTAGEEEVILPPISENKAYIVRSLANHNEFYMFENRQLHGWDKYAPGEGLLVWHIDYDEATWRSNTVNNVSDHQRVDLVEADGIASSNSRSGDSFPGTADIREFTSSSRPAFVTWNGASYHIGLYNIDVDDEGNVTFNVISDKESLPDVTGVNATDASPVGFTASWNKVAGATSYVIEVYTKTVAGTSVVKHHAAGYRSKIVGDTDSEVVTGLEPSTDYFCIVRAMGGGLIGNYSAETKVTTLDRDFRFEIPITDLPADVTKSAFTARWQPLEGAESYSVSVYELSFDDETIYHNDFSGDIVTPEGWSATPGCTINKFYGGEAQPALTMSGNLLIQSPGDNRDIQSVSFWCRGLSSGWDDVNEITISGYCGQGEWIELRKIWPVTTESSGEIITLSKKDLFTPVHSIRIGFNRPYGSGTLLIDDIDVKHMRSTATVLPAYDNVDAGKELSMHIDGLKPSTSYRYIVTASDGTMLSKPSRPVDIITADASAISSETTDCTTMAVSTEGRSLLLINRTCTDESVAVYTATGSMVGRVTVESCSSARFDLPNEGIYIISYSSGATKIAVR